MVYNQHLYGVTVEEVRTQPWIQHLIPPRWRTRRLCFALTWLWRNHGFLECGSWNDIWSNQIRPFSNFIPRKQSLTIFASAWCSLAAHSAWRYSPRARWCGPQLGQVSLRARVEAHFPPLCRSRLAFRSIHSPHLWNRMHILLVRLQSERSRPVVRVGRRGLPSRSGHARWSQCRMSHPIVRRNRTRWKL